MADVEFDPYALYDFGAENLDPNLTYCIEAQEIFEIGTHRGRPYTGNDNETIAANFKRFFFTDPQPLLMPPAVVGHEEDQEVLKRSDLPAAGWVKACFIGEGTKLLVNIGEIPALVMYWIKTGKIRTVSAEIYDDSGDAGLPPGHGPTLRRVAFLGGDIPQVKTLARLKIPVPEKRAKALQFNEDRVRVYSMPITAANIRYFAEKTPMAGATNASNVKTNGNREDFTRKTATLPQKNSEDNDADADDQPVTNSEGRTMKHPKLFDEMKKEGVSEDVASKMSDMEPDMLRKMSACMKRFADQLAPPTQGNPADNNPPAFDRAAAIEMIASKNGIDRQTLEQKTDDELKALMGPASMSDSQEEPTDVEVGESQAPDSRMEDTTGGAPASAQADAIVQKHSDGSKKPARKHSEGASVELEQTRNRLARLERQLAEQTRREKLASLKTKQGKVNKFCEEAIAAGKVTPAEVSGGLKDLLMSADDEVVRKFSDGSSATALQKQMDIIEKRPKLHVFSEKLPASGDDAAAQAERIKLLKATEAGRKALAREAAAAAKS